MIDALGTLSLDALLGREMQLNKNSDSEKKKDKDNSKKMETAKDNLKKVFTLNKKNKVAPLPIQSSESPTFSKTTVRDSGVGIGSSASSDNSLDYTASDMAFIDATVRRVASSGLFCLMMIDALGTPALDALFGREMKLNKK